MDLCQRRRHAHELLHSTATNSKKTGKPKITGNPLPYPTTLESNDGATQNQRPMARKASPRPQKHSKHRSLHSHRENAIQHRSKRRIPC